jgi:predicted branched-subunit amino acid permease
MHFGFTNVSATHVTIFRVVRTLIPLNFHEFLISANFANNLIVIPVFKKVFGSFVLSDSHFPT